MAYSLHRYTVRPSGTVLHRHCAKQYQMTLSQHFLYFVHVVVQMGLFPWEIRVAFPKESQLQQSRATQPSNHKVHAGSFRVSIPLDSFGA